MDQPTTTGSTAPSAPQKKGKGLVWVIIIILLAVGIWVLASGSKTEAPTEEVTPTAEPTPAPTPAAAVKSVTITGSNFKYDLAEIRVKEGETVRLTFKNADGFHDWVLDEFSARTKQFQGPGEETIEFVADKAGTFEYYCSVGKHRQMGMKGNLIVE